MATRSTAITSQDLGDSEYAGRVLNYAWNPSTLAFEIVTVAGAGVGGEVIVTSSALPTGAATAARQDTGNASLSAIAGEDFATQATLALIKAKTDNIDVLLSTRTKPADTQPVSGPLTDTQLRASAVPVSVAAATPIFRGRASTFRTAGRAGTTGQKILSLHNATGSPVIVTVNKVAVDLVQTVIKAVTVLPPVVRLWLVTVLPTNGTALTKNQVGGSGASAASVTVKGDASADGTGSGTTLTATLPAGAILTQEFAPRFITAAGYEPADRIEFLGDTTVELGPLEGVVLFLDYVLATQNPITDMWIATIDWSES